MKNRIFAIFHFGMTPFILLSLILSLFGTPQPAYAAGFDVQPLAWNIIGLDSNKPNTGPNHFPVGVRVCNNSGEAVSDVTATLNWDSTNPYIDLRPGTSDTVIRFASPDSLAAGDCADFYFEVEVDKNTAAYDTTRRYHVDVTAVDAATGLTNYSGGTPTPRELYVEHLVSQSRNAVTDVQYGTSVSNLASVPAGGTMALVVGQTYFIKLVGFTATQGYNQLESFINFPNTIFQVLSVESVYSAPSAGYTIDKMYSDACGWDNVISSPTYRSCIVSDDKTGGDISVTYEVKILKVPDGTTTPVTNPEPLSTLIYDFSGSSYHYNSDFEISARYAYILDATAIDISKSFSPATIAPGSTSTLTFTLKNNAPVSVAGVSFLDGLPDITPADPTTGQMTVDPATYTTSGCGALSGMNFTSGDTSLEFTGGSIAPSGTCTISVSVNVPDDPTSGDYQNISGNVFVGDLDSGHHAEDTLTIDSNATVPGTGICGVPMASWDLADATATVLTQPYMANASNVATAEMSWGNGLTVEGDTSTGGAGGGNPVPGAKAYGWLKTDPIDPATSPYIEFAVDTSQYTAVQLQFDAQRKNNGPDNDAFYYYDPSTTSWVSKNTFAPTMAWVTFPSVATYYDFTGQTSTTGITYFRIYGNGANATNSGNDLSIDNIQFTGCSVPIQPTLTKAFSPSPVVVGGTSTLTFTLSNDNTIDLTGAKFTDTLPTGLEYDIASTPSTSCGGSPSMTFAGNTTYNFGQTTGATIPPGGCTVSVDVIATTEGPHQNISDFIYTTEGGTNSDPSGSAKASLVAVLPPTIEKNFNPSTILANGTSTLTFIITNPNPSDDLSSNVDFSDTLPSGMTLASDVTTPQCGGTVTGTAGTDVIGFSNGTIPAGDSCEVTAEVTASSLGDYVNTSDPVTVTIGGITIGTDTATATLAVKEPNPAISILKRISTSSTGPWYSYLTVAPGTPIYYQFTVENTGDVDLDNVSVSDPTLTGLTPPLDLSGCSWAFLAKYSDAVTCVVGPTTALAGSNSNTATAQGTYTVDSQTVTVSSSALYTGVNSGDFTLLKQISTQPTGPWASSIMAVDPGSTVYYKFTIVNATGGPLTSINVIDVDTNVDPTSCVFTDPLPDGSATTCIVSATVSTTDMSKHTNTATAYGTDGSSTVIDSSPSSADYTPKAPDLTVAKSNDTSDSGKVGTSFTWTISVGNVGIDTATFADGQTVLSDPLPVNATYANFGDPALANLSCTLDTVSTPNTITCAASGGDFSMAPAGSFDITVDVTPTAAGDLQNTATVDPDANITEISEGNNASTDTVTVLAPPSIAKSFLDNPIAASGTSTLSFTITNPNTTTALTGVAFNDTLPTGMFLAADATTPQCGGTVSGTSGLGTVSLSGGSIAADSNCTVDVTVTVVAGGDYANTSGSVSSTNGGTGNTATDTLKVFELVKSIVSTSEDSTTVQGSYERVAVGEIIRYRLITTLPEGTWNNFQIVDVIDTGIQFLNDATVSFDCDGACSNSTFTITPDPTASPYPYGSSTDPTFDLGTVANPDTDSNPEYLIIEFNALVLNMTGNNSAGLTRNNSYTVSANGSQISTSPEVGVRIAEPSITDLTKTVSPATDPYVLGDTITYTLKFSNTSSGVGRGTAFDVYLTDTLDATYLDLQSVSVTTPTGVTVTDTSTTGVGGEVKVYLDALPPAVDISSGPTDVTITVTAKIVGSPANGQTISNTANLTYTSLPGGTTTGGSNGTCPNSTGSCTPGTSGSLTGERNGDGGAPNDYNDTASVDITTSAGTITIEKQTVPDASAQSFTFTPSYNGGTTFDLTDGTNNASGNLAPGTHTVVESSVSGWALTDLTCTGDTDNGSTLTVATGTASIDLDAGENITCTFTNSQNALPDAVNDGPQAVDAGSSDNVVDVLANDDFGLDGPSNTAITVTVDPAHGTATVDDNSTPSDPTDDTVLYTPTAGYSGTDSFTYQICDSNVDCDTAVASLNVNALPDAVNDGPQAVDAGSSDNVVDVLANDDFGLDGPSNTAITVTVDPAHGTATVDDNSTPTDPTDDTVLYTPTAGYNGPDSFTYQICDVDNDCDPATVDITIDSVDDTPTAVDDSTTANEDTPVTINELGNDNYGGDGANATAPIVLPDGLNGLLEPAHGTVALDNNGTPGDLSDDHIVYTPDTNYNGTDSFEYQICDVDGDCDTATVDITIDPVDDPVMADDESYSTSEDTLLTVAAANGVLPGDSYPDGFGSLTVTTDVSHGTLVLNTSDGSFTYMPDANWNGTDSFEYEVCDADSGTQLPVDCDTGLVTITVDPVNDVPVANDDSFSATEDTPLNDDLKPDNGSGADVASGDGGNVWSKLTNPSHGTVTVNANGTFSYTPDANYNGPDSFTYQICDVDNDCDPATVNLTITSVEDPAIGIAKDVVDIIRAGSGTFDVTLEFNVRNYGDVALSAVQVTDDLSVTFPAPNSFTVQSVAVSNLTNAVLTANPGYNGNTDTNLLTGTGNTLSVNGNGTITVVVRVIPSSSGPFDNVAFVTGESPTGTTVTDESSDGTDPDDTANCSTCINGDGDPTNNTKPTPINFDPNIFDPPFGFKEVDASGLPVLHWTMIWINDNNFPSSAAVNDPIPAGVTYETTGSASGTGVPVGAPLGSTDVGVTCSPDPTNPASTTTTTWCYYEGPTGTYPRGRIVWEGVLGPDMGATNQATANDELYITFAVRVVNGVTTVQNTATIDADLNNNRNYTDPGEHKVASAQVTWQEPATPPAGRVGKKLPATGFAPGKVTILLDQTSDEAYAELGDLWLEIPSLGIKTPIVGVPTNAGVWDVTWLGQQVGWLQGTAFPTWQGNSVVTGHVYLPNGKPGPFVDLSKLRFGDQVIVHAFGQRHIYEVRTNHIITPDDMSPFKHEEKAWLTLLTCKGYDESSDTYKYRVEMRAVLAKVTAE